MSGIFKYDEFKDVGVGKIPIRLSDNTWGGTTSSGGAGEPEIVFTGATVEDLGNITGEAGKIYLVNKTSTGPYTLYPWYWDVNSQTFQTIQSMQDEDMFQRILWLERDEIPYLNSHFGLYEYTYELYPGGVSTFPETGEGNKLYVDTTNPNVENWGFYRWAYWYDGSGYEEVYSGGTHYALKTLLSVGKSNIVQETTGTPDLSQGGIIKIDRDVVGSILNPLNMYDGLRCTFVLKQGIQGNLNISWDSNYKFAGGTPPTLTATVDAIDIVEFIVLDGFLNCTNVSLDVKVQP